MLNFEERTGPDLGADAPAYPDAVVPDWYRDAKLGFFVHWGVYSVPAWGTPHAEGSVPDEDAYAHHQYAEWYANTVRIDGSPTRRRHEERYGVGTSYEDLADLWDVTGFDADALVGDLVAAGGRYVVPTTKHHDGFCLWDTTTTPFNAARRGPGRDLIAEIARATRDAGARLGLYYSGALDWHTSEYPPIESSTDLFRLRRDDDVFARYAAAQLRELVDRFSPDVLWNDIDWPDAGKTTAPHGLAALLREYLEAVPDGVVNDRWGVPFHGFWTREYSHVPETLAHPWEATRGLGWSFGYNEAEGPEHTIGERELIHLLVDVVSKNGNLLLNVGPRADGSIPGLQRDRLAALGRWLGAHGDAIYGTRPWVRSGDVPSDPVTGRPDPRRSPVAYTSRGDEVFVHVLEPGSGLVALAPELAGAADVTWLDDGASAGRAGADGDAARDVVVPALRHDAHVAVLRVRR
ncbi:alpha-L-fucosidase [Krasilnikoviella flava]|uniref:alpha-L-fucosidase n=1 Tax=Krasilnikoviella flava TaxID=526729 RepID=A0A1T5LEQ0_9MICO|nr:alpha-L-fucosidase [Krasilnikoviella flava]SKC74516.1 alpha-L-fucosidase [Krasilnikoviella flava]